ncbi:MULTISPECIES: phosphoribosylaminoimidazolesuccinocarboxamide synthase [Staphylococcus]|jgi:phosphoribosylaminoimidazole-succinocarboxamide synthase|uniref:Phosphoribosylaminoimidazole-succinocarboxamide synthase n=1 Tax=Staphylococcus nepalensis TaxID=214473 RepID=A0A291JLA4_9STAP|nr:MULTISPECIES: phosphoribosylaminoimidazolesuccinocarboxamide synthase [Staphylococcus]VDG67549.1 phosphoribosylaminoimidazole-succinocarboxamide synthase [Lacrimispora indolis]ATH60532.1 phosphoribosylaminoimidazolesuccinocarboxamide synthase [Staphylococcus nepalensis]ATH65578.1 phosphoribosylaminoimidazolesuccinocarboxamide synthase [Staphylococcus nepalensis]AWI44950.1 phosphoribosylaminoimidazolesuccinocarboxamide synthase [Staphylococcus nepalensis]MBO1204583.1 phosphoribosylaminoimida
MSLLYEGKAKRIFSTEQPGVLRVEYKDEVTAGNGAKKDYIEGKGRLNNQITSRIFNFIKARGIESHFIEQTSETEQLVKSVDIIPLEVVVRNIAAGSITKRLGFEKGHEFESPLVEFFYKNDNLNDPLITEDHIQLLHLASEEDIELLKNAAKAINAVLVQLMDEMELRLVDFKIEFGRNKSGQIILADEISPDTCRIWDKYSDTNFDKDVYREDTGSIIETYQTFLNKLEEL